MRTFALALLAAAGFPGLLSAPYSLAQSSTAKTATHHARTAASAPVCPPAPAQPALPPGVPPVTGSVAMAFALRYVDVETGTGDTAAAGNFLTVHYTGWLAKDGTKFDSSVDRGEPITFQQGAHRVIPGWDQGFEGMKVGGKRRLYIPFQLAYGDSGRPPVIPPQSDLIFDIELVAAGATPPSPPAAPASPAAPQHPATPPSR